MTVTISPLELMLDDQNPRFVILSNRDQASIRKYLVSYEDAWQLALAINEYGGLLPGERIVALFENGHYTVIEGNRRTCALQFLLSRELIPDKFIHKIPHPSPSVLETCETIEIDLLKDRDAALELMTKRHIQGIKEWKPLAKKQFFASNFDNILGQTIPNLSKITGERESAIKQDIRDYKFFLSTYQKYQHSHPSFVTEIINVKTDPFWRIFTVKFEYPKGIVNSPKAFLKIDYDEQHNTISDLPNQIFEKIVELVFQDAIVNECITTRNVLSDVNGVVPLLQEIFDLEHKKSDSSDEGEDNSKGNESKNDQEPENNQQNAEQNNGQHEQNPKDSQQGTSNEKKDDSKDGDKNGSGGPTPGGPPPSSFFESISWHNKLNPNDSDHRGMILAISELYKLSRENISRQKAYTTFPISTGMVLRTAYEQALRLHLKKAQHWGLYLQSISKKKFPTLSSMEDYINCNKQAVFKNNELLLVYDSVIAAKHRDFLNATIHRPDLINVTSSSLEGVASGGMFALIQGIINGL